MSETSISLKTQWSEVLDTLNLILLCFGIFTTIISILIYNPELTIESCIIFVVYIIFAYINRDSTKISANGITSRKYGLIKWDNFKKIIKKNNIFYIYFDKSKNPYKFIIDKSEDKLEVERAYKYILSKEENIYEK